MLAQRSRTHKLWDGIPAGGGPSRADGGAGQRELMNKRPAIRSHVFPGVKTEFKAREG